MRERTSPTSLEILLDNTPVAFTKQAAKCSEVTSAINRVLCIAQPFLVNGKHIAPKSADTLRERCLQGALALYPHLVAAAESLVADAYTRRLSTFTGVAAVLGMTVDELARRCDTQAPEHFVRLRQKARRKGLRYIERQAIDLGLQRLNALHNALVEALD